MESARLGSQFPSRINLEPQHAGVIKRIRQACSNCRYVTIAQGPEHQDLSYPECLPLSPRI